MNRYNDIGDGLRKCFLRFVLEKSNSTYRNVDFVEFNRFNALLWSHINVSRGKNYLQRKY